MSGSKSSDASLDAAVAHPADANAAAALQLTVHTPVQAQLPQSRRGRWQLWFMLLVCVAPVVASYFMYYVVRPQGRTNFGELIEPQHPMPEHQRLTALDGSVSELGDLRQQWLLVSVAGGACDEICRNNLYMQRQLRESLGESSDRVDWVWLVSDDATPPEEIRPALAKATVRRMDLSALQAWLKPAPGHQLEEHLYLVDPMGNWMMRFPPRLDIQGAERVKRDLSRLLHATAGWDRPGRQQGSGG